ncbi:beta-lactamase family protein [Galbibacter sp. EGI 63066]|uniref:beta-lactamase family protein n=1 Tax=Galbibacter sp. EGI 63066 TaxID=2993559 RepID=UPI002249831E|nr:beta-lactamase family protein [Galbibacter sp. EGI 63066]MCX2679389.1 beta-lactamase family protein [Galbibacter sp. EGI 63066]
MKATIFLTTLIVFLTQISIAQNFNHAKLDNYFDALETNDLFMGSVAVSQNGEIIYTKSVGFSDFENKVKANENSKYRIGSITKTFTSVLTLKAVEGKKLTLDQTIENYFPTIKNSNKITIKHLLSHRSGIHNFTSNENYRTWDRQSKTEREMVEIITKGGSDFEPGSKTVYSNSNYVLLTYILEKTFKKPYSALLKTYITEPVGLKSTFFGKKINTDNNECKSYKFVDNWKAESETDISIPLGAGGIVSTSKDLVKFSDALFNGKLLSAKSLELMKTYSLGLFQGKLNNKTSFGHNGAIDAFTSLFSYFPEESISFALTSNGKNYDNIDILKTVLNAIYSKSYEVPKKSIYLEISGKVIQDVSIGIESYLSLKKEHPDEYDFDNSNELNRLGYVLLELDKNQSAIEIFKLATTEFLENANLFDSLGEAYFIDKQYDLALSNYKKAIVLGGTNGNAKKMVDKIEKVKGK